jgi:hypothetical protein
MPVLVSPEFAIDGDPTLPSATAVRSVAGEAALAHTVPLLVRTLPDVDGATLVTALVPAPTRTLFAVCVAAPVPPDATANALVSVTLPWSKFAVSTISSLSALLTSEGAMPSAIETECTSVFDAAVVL